jgi:hypothetical protein
MFEVRLSKESNTIIVCDVHLRGPNGLVNGDFLLDTGAAYSMIE